MPPLPVCLHALDPDSEATRFRTGTCDVKCPLNLSSLHQLDNVTVRNPELACAVGYGHQDGAARRARCFQNISRQGLNACEFSFHGGRWRFGG